MLDATLPKIKPGQAGMRASEHGDEGGPRTSGVLDDRLVGLVLDENLCCYLVPVQAETCGQPLEVLICLVDLTLKGLISCLSIDRHIGSAPVTPPPGPIIAPSRQGWDHSPYVGAAPTSPL
jgi:hypothetical protein